MVDDVVIILINDDVHFRFARIAIIQGNNPLGIELFKLLDVLIEILFFNFGYVDGKDKSFEPG